LKAAATSGGNQGILMRFASYRTLYYQAAIYKGKRILNGEELVAAYLDGFTGANPARSAMLGSIGVWEAGELASAPTGRLLAPASPAQLVKSSATASLGPAMVKVDSKRNVLVVDFISAFPEKNEQLDKADFGPLKLQARDASGNVIHIASLPYGAYDRHAYESTGGISEFPLPAGGIGAGAIELVQEQAKKPVAILSQSRFVAETDDWGVYVDQGQTVPVRIKVTENGGPPGPGVKLLLKEYNSDGNFAVPPDVQVCDAAGKPVTDGIVPVVNGEALLSVRSIQPGACFLAFYPFVGAPPTSIPTANFPLPTSFYCCIRMLPFDDELERTTPDSQLSWSFLYTKVLRVFDLIYPVMSLVRNLHDRNVVEAMCEQLKFAVSLDTFESTLYMPITRDLSAGKRKLLQRFVNLLPNRVPPDPPGQP
jgi:hypothetical protein